eukprot:12794.XXX_692780_692980_1 [CDS] Oithona nana genome sequencing.
MSRCPCKAAKCNGVVPTLSLGFLSTNKLQICFTTFNCPNCAAECSGVAALPQCEGCSGLGFESFFV